MTLFDFAQSDRAITYFLATLKEPTFTPDQVQLAMDALEQVPAIDSLAELKLFYTGAQEAGILTIPVQGKTLNAAVTARKKELEK